MTTLKAEVLFFVFTIYLSSEFVYEWGAKDRNFKGKPLFGSNFTFHVGTCMVQTIIRDCLEYAIFLRSFIKQLFFE